jgi:hypothetical protein
MSAAVCRDPTWVHRLDDDLESHVHVLTWLVFRYLHTNVHVAEAHSELVRLFEDQYMSENDMVGGKARSDFLQNPGLHWEPLEVPGNAPMNMLLMKLYAHFAPRYRMLTGRRYITEQVPWEPMVAMFAEALSPDIIWPPTPRAHDVVDLFTPKKRPAQLDSDLLCSRVSARKRSRSDVDVDEVQPASTHDTKCARTDSEPADKAGAVIHSISRVAVGE